MLKLINELSDKPEWWRKVKDDEIAAKWKKEALEMDWGAIQRWGDFTPAMADAVSQKYPFTIKASYTVRVEMSI